MQKSKDAWNKFTTYVRSGPLGHYISSILAASGIILCMDSANQRRRYIVKLSLTSWAHAQNDPCILV